MRWLISIRSGDEIFSQRPNPLLVTLSMKHTSVKGLTIAVEANQIASRHTGQEIVFINMPCSAIQYSRFYHILEAVAVGGYSEVLGAGRGQLKDSSTDFP